MKNPELRSKKIKVNGEYINLKLVNAKNIKELEHLHITFNHNGKMECMVSLSTNCKTNPNCQKNRNKEGSICKKCYADTQINCFKNMEPCLQQNSEILSSKLLEHVPIINALYFRFEAFGDVINATHLLNYLLICKCNPKVTFTLFSKHLYILNQVFTGMEVKKPKNLIIIYSDLFEDVRTDYKKIKKVFPFIDKVFTVYSTEQSRAEAEKTGSFTCGKKCINCLACYTKNSIKQIAELEK